MKTFWMLQIGKRHFLSSPVLFHCFLTIVRCCTNLSHLGNILQSLGYFLPTAYLPSYVVRLGFEPTVGTILLAVNNTTSVFGGIVIGMLADRFQVTSVILFSTVGSAIAVFLFWGLSSQIPLLVFFASFYGFFAGSFSSTWSGILTELKREAPTLDTGFVFGVLAGGRGVGNAISGPLAVALITNKGWIADGRQWGYSTEYGPLIIFTGATAVLGGWGWMWRCACAR